MQRRMQSVWTFFALRFFHSHLFTALKKFQWIWTNVDSTVENWKEKKKLWGWETQIDWFSYHRGKKYTNGFCCRYNIFFHSSDLNERKKLSIITKDTGKTTQLYMGHCRRKLICVNKSHTLNAKKNTVRKEIKKHICTNK